MEVTNIVYAADTDAAADFAAFEWPEGTAPVTPVDCAGCTEVCCRVGGVPTGEPTDCCGSLRMEEDDGVTVQCARLCPGISLPSCAAFRPECCAPSAQIRSAAQLRGQRCLRHHAGEPDRSPGRLDSGDGHRAEVGVDDGRPPRVHAGCCSTPDAGILLRRARRVPRTHWLRVRQPLVRRAHHPHRASSRFV